MTRKYGNMRARVRKPAYLPFPQPMPRKCGGPADLQPGVPKMAASRSLPCLVVLALGVTASCAPPDPRPVPAARRSAPEPAAVEAGQPAVPGEYDLAPDVLHYDIELALGGPEIEAHATLSVRPNGAARIPLDLTGLGVRSVRVDDQPVSFEYEDGKLRVPLGDPDGGAAGDTGDPGDEAADAGAGPDAATAADAPVRVAVAYHGVPDDGLILRDNVHGAPAAFVDNWPNRARFWLPSVDHPADKATAAFTVHAPSDWQVVANGALVAEPELAAADALGHAGSAGPRATWRWASRVPHPTYTLVVGAASFAVESVGRAACGAAPASPDADGCIDVSFWVFPQDTAFARQVFRRAPAMVDYFTALIGPYPFEKLAHVQSATRFGGMENSSAIFYSERAIAEGRLSEGTVSHEIAHQWFGDSATQADWNHLWLSEGFATYFGALFFEAADGEDDFRRRMEQSRQGYLESDVVARPVVDPAGADNLFDLLNRNNYNKGGWVLHMLRGVVGDETFFRAIRTYYERHAFGNALTEDLQRAFEEAGATELDWFFDQWIERPGHPTLEHSWETTPDGTEVVLTVAQTQSPEWPTFRLPMAVDVRGPAGTRRHRVVVESRSQVFRFPAAAPAGQGVPTEVVLDPGGWVLKGYVSRP